MRGLIVALGAGALVMLPATAAQAHHRHHHRHHHSYHHPMVGSDGHGKMVAPAPVRGMASPGQQIHVGPDTDGHGKNQ